LIAQKMSVQVPYQALCRVQTAYGWLEEIREGLSGEG
jgi:hypothetical protein